MSATASDNRLAILLSLLDDQSLTTALAEFGEERAQAIRKVVAHLRESPPDTEEIESVLDDFDRFFRFAVDTLNLPSTSPLPITGSASAPRGADPGEPSVAKQSPSKLRIFDPSDDPIADLHRLEPAQIARALAHEHPKTVAIVLSKLEHNLAAEAMDALPEEMQYQVFSLLKEDLDVADELISQVVRATVNRGMSIEPEETEDLDSDQRMVDLLRELPKKTRVRLIDELRRNDEETANRLQELLYLFEDLLHYDNRSVQKILGAIESRILVVALQDSDEAISQKIFENLSKRATAALQEELELMSKTSEEEVEGARKSIAAIIAKLDQSGELTAI